MNSFNHYAYGAIGEWMYRVIAGIEIDAEHPGYKHIMIQPQPGGGLTYAKASVHSMYGRVASSWEVEDGKMTVEVEVPANITATVRLPGARMEDVMENGKAVQASAGISSVRQVDEGVFLNAGSGSYGFEVGVPEGALRAREEQVPPASLRSRVGMTRVGVLDAALKGRSSTMTPVRKDRQLAL